MEEEKKDNEKKGRVGMLRIDTAGKTRSQILDEICSAVGESLDALDVPEDAAAGAPGSPAWLTDEGRRREAAELAREIFAPAAVRLVREGIPGGDPGVKEYAARMNSLAQASLAAACALQTAADEFIKMKP